MLPPRSLAPLPLVTEYAVTPGQPWAYNDRVTCVVAPNPGPFTFAGTNSYLIGSDRLAVLDPGPDDDTHLAALIEAIDGRPVSHVFVTHTHRDHSPLALRLAHLVDAEVVGCGPHPSPRFPPEAEMDRSESDAVATSDDRNGETEDATEDETKGESGDRGFRPDRQLHHGDRVAGEGWEIETVATPGHLANHLCFALAEDGVLFTGDHIMGWSTSVISPVEGDLGDFLASCALLLDRSDRVYLSAHGAPITDPRQLVRAFIEHRKGRSQQILTVLSERDGAAADLSDFVALMYPDLDARLVKAAKATVLSHLLDLSASGFVEIEGTLPSQARFRRTDWC